MEVTHYPRNRETREQRTARIERARQQAVTALTPREFTSAPDGLRWKGIVDGTEVRVSPRWKPSKRARQYYGRQQKERMVARARVVEPHKSDIALMAQMGTIHDANDTN